MRPSDERPGELVSPTSGTAVPIPPQALREATVLPPAGYAAGPAAVAAPVGGLVTAPAELEGMLLPTEGVTFASSPHPIIFVRPLVGIAVILIALSVVLSWQLHPVVRGHHVTVPLVSGIGRTAVLVVAGLLLLQQLFHLAQRAFHFFSFRVVTTNRRVFIVEGIFGRRVLPLGNTALAGATMSQGILGRMLNFGNLFLPLAGAGPRAIRDVREPVRLYREFEIVANGVEGDVWKQAIRQTQIP
ncbi:MAG TPA: PH domain-containing protein [Candidatus Elarobacter sp.]|jgi:hypothetical protein|nr:PH domain-containing protein [Candidatus Elarobacter sp.]